MRRNIDEGDVLNDVLEALQVEGFADVEVKEARRVIAVALDKAREEGSEIEREERREAGRR
jgi:hypothetical protein